MGKSIRPQRIRKLNERPVEAAGIIAPAVVQAHAPRADGGKRNRKNRSLPLFRLRDNRSAVALRNAPADGKPKPKPVRDGMLRVSFGPSNTKEEVDQLAQALLSVTQNLVAAGR